MFPAAASSGEMDAGTGCAFSGSVHNEDDSKCSVCH